MGKIDTEHDAEKNIRFHKMTGTFNVKELLRMMIELYTSPTFDPNMNSVWDLRDASFSSFSQSDINRIREIVSRHWAKEGKSKSAIITGQNDTARMAQFYEVILDIAPGKEVMRFTCDANARKWITGRDA